MIPNDKIEEVRSASDIVEVVEDFGVRLKQSGSRYKGLCPFHEEKTPSFSVDPEQKLYYCFGCQQGGNIFSFVQEMEGATFVESVRLLAERAGVALPEAEDDPEAHTEVESIYAVLRFAARFYYEQLTQTDAGRPALDYLRNRGFTPKTIKQFGLGYAPDEWEALLRAAHENHLTDEVLEKAGLVKPRKKGDGYYDVFRGRVMFPILSHIGKVLGFGGRVLDADADKPKYINSPDTRVYNKRRVLYGLHQAKRPIRRSEEVLLVEGYTDVMALHQAGIENVVASSGTALTEDHIDLLERYAKRILLLYDADEAGANAALRGIDMILESGMAPYVVALPGGEDPDSYVLQQGGEAFASYVEEERRDFTAFKYQQAARTGALDTPEGEADVMRSVVDSIAKIPDPLMQETYLRRASDVLSVPDIRLHEVLDRVHKDREKKQQRRKNRSQPEGSASPKKQTAGEPAGRQRKPALPAEPSSQEPLPQEKLLLRLMLERGKPLVKFILGNMAVDEFTDGPARRAIDALVDMYEEGTIDAQRLIGGEAGSEVQQLASSVMMEEHEASAGWQEHGIKVPTYNEDPYEAAASAMTLLKLRRVEQAISEQKNKIYRASQQGVDLQPLQKEMMELQQLRKHIDQRAFLEQDVT